MAHYSNKQQKSLIVNQFGDPVSATPRVKASAYPNLPYSFGKWGNHPVQLFVHQDTEKTLDTSTRQNIVSISRQLFWQMSILETATQQKSQWVVGNDLGLIFTGKDKEWGELAKEKIEQLWFPLCNVRGNAFDFVTTLQILSQTIDRDGDCLMVLTKTRAGWPLIQIVPCHRIGQRQSYKDNIVDDSPRWNGWNITDGVVTNNSGRPLAYLVLGKTKDDDQYISAADAYLIGEPQYCDNNRFLPSITSALLDGLSVQEIDQLLQITVKVESSQTLIETNEQGEADPSSGDLAWNEDSNIPPVTDPNVLPSWQYMDGNAIRYVKSGTGKLEPFPQSRPHMNTQNFVTRLETRLCAPIWPHQMFLSPEKLGGAAARGIQAIARKYIEDRQGLLYKYAKLAITYAVSRFVDQGIIPFNNDFYKWTFTKPALPTLDSGYERQADITDYKLGAITMDDLVAKQGKRYKDVLATRQQETVTFFNAVDNVYKQLGGTYTKEVITDFMSQRNANPLTPNSVQQDAQPFPQDETSNQ